MTIYRNRQTGEQIISAGDAIKMTLDQQLAVIEQGFIYCTQCCEWYWKPEKPKFTDRCSRRKCVDGQRKSH